MWNKPDDELIALGTTELAVLGLVAEARSRRGYVVRMPKAYPFYDEPTRPTCEPSATGSRPNAPNVHPVGRNGMHKYNNQDHSMYTAMLTVENILGADHDIWTVNVEEEYHEAGSTGRDAPVLPRRTAATAGTRDPGWAGPPGRCGGDRGGPGPPLSEVETPRSLDHHHLPQ